MRKALVGQICSRTAFCTLAGKVGHRQLPKGPRRKQGGDIRCQRLCIGNNRKLRSKQIYGSDSAGPIKAGWIKAVTPVSQYRKISQQGQDIPFKSKVLTIYIQSWRCGVVRKKDPRSSSRMTGKENTNSSDPAPSHWF